MVNRGQWNWSVRLLVSLCVLSYVLSQVDEARMLESVRLIRWPLLCVAILIYFPGKLLEAYRWCVVLRGLGQEVRFGVILYYSLLGLLSSMFLPGQLSGDVVKVVTLGRRHSNVKVVILSAVIDKCSVVAGVLMFVLLGQTATGPIAQQRGLFVVGVCTLVVVMVIYLLLCLVRRERWPGESGVCKSVSAIRRGVVLLRETLWLPKLTLGECLQVLMLGILLQGLNTVGSFALLQSLRIDMAFVDWSAINAMVVFIQLLPVSIGGLGVREGALAGLLSMYGISGESAVAMSLLGFVAMVLLTSVSWWIVGAVVSRAGLLRNTV